MVNLSSSDYKSIMSWAKKYEINLPSEKSELENLESLNIDTEEIKTLPSAFSKLHLKHLEINFEQVAGIKYEHILQIISQMKSLETLEISASFGSNKKAVLLYKDAFFKCNFSNLTNLKKFEFVGMFGDILDEIPSEIFKIKSLESLTFDGSIIKQMNEFLYSSKRLTSNENIIKQIPKEIANLVNLKHLKIAYAGFKELPNEICKLEKLEILKLNDVDRLTKLPKNIGNLKNLKELEIGGNISALPASIVKLTNLENLAIDNLADSLESLPKEIANLVNLKHLSLSLNNVDFPFEWVCKCRNLETLSLRGANIYEVPDCIKNLVNLRKLNLTNCKIKRISPEMFNLINLESLNLDSNHLTSIDDDIKKLVNLEVLSLNYNELSNIPAYIYEFKNLNELYLANNKISKISPKISNLQKLGKLRLDNNNLDNLPKEMGELKKLNLLFINGNHFKESDLPKEILTMKERIFDYSV